MSEGPNERIRVRRIPDRGRYDRATIDPIVDETLLCHVAWTTPQGPACVPLLHARVDDTLYVHGAPATRLARQARDPEGGLGVDVCLTVTLLDGLILARSAFHHSVNYRSVVVYGRATPVEDDATKRHALEVLIRRIYPGRETECRPPSDKELRATAVLSIPLDDASAKIRTGPPVDDAPDLALDHWAGVIPLHVERGAPSPAPDLREGIETPDALRP